MCPRIFSGPYVLGMRHAFLEKFIRFDLKFDPRSKERFVAEKRLLAWQSCDFSSTNHEQASFSLAVPGPLGGGRVFYFLMQ